MKKKALKKLLKQALAQLAAIQQAAKADEGRPLSEWLTTYEQILAEQVQTLLGHKTAEMTALYTDDRGLSAGDWKRVDVKEVVEP